MQYAHKVTLWRVRVTFLQWKSKNAFSVSVIELHVTVTAQQRFMVNLCHRQQFKLYVPVFEINYTYIPNNCHSFHTVHIKAALIQNNVYLLMAFFRRTIWLNRS
jgi:hypothetical protein